MTSDFITLTCPSCGGKLEISSSTTSLKCPNCGNEHLVRHEGALTLLESFARCPVCGRNDEVRKLTAIISSDTENLQETTIQKHSYQDKDGHWYTSTEQVPFNGRRASNLAMKLQLPPQPSAEEPKRGCGQGLIIFFVLIFGFSALGSLITSLSSGFNSMASFLLYGILAALLAWWYVSLEKKYRQQMKIYKDRTEQIATSELGRWQRARQRWDLTYYCFRDDRVFIPGENGSVSPEYLNNLLYNQPN